MKNARAWRNLRCCGGYVLFFVVVQNKSTIYTSRRAEILSLTPSFLPSPPPQLYPFLQKRNIQINKTKNNSRPLTPTQQYFSGTDQNRQEDTRAQNQLRRYRPKCHRLKRTTLPLLLREYAFQSLQGRTSTLPRQQK